MSQKRTIRVLITGATGFIGAHFWEHIATLRPDWEVVVLDGLTYAGNQNRIHEIDDFPGQFARGKIRFVFHDIRAPLVGNEILMAQIGPVDYIVHFAAETHVDRSVEDPTPFVQTNVMGTFHLLEFARAQGKRLKRYVQISTDEVYGPAAPGQKYKEWDRTRPSNPYSATKTGADALVQAWIRTYGLPGVIIRTMNNIGERQHPEKFVPKTIRTLLMGRRVTIHGKKGEIGSRHWIHPRNFADGILFAMEHHRDTVGEIVNIAGTELDNLEVAEIIASELGTPFAIVSLTIRRCGRHMIADTLLMIATSVNSAGRSPFRSNSPSAKPSAG